MVALYCYMYHFFLSSSLVMGQLDCLYSWSSTHVRSMISTTFSQAAASDSVGSRLPYLALSMILRYELSSSLNASLSTASRSGRVERGGAVANGAKAERIEANVPRMYVLKC